MERLKAEMATSRGQRRMDILDKLRTMKYAQIEEAMNNQFGDSLTNMNVKPATAIDFTIVFRNVPKEMANINVEVVDSKPGGS